MREGDTAIERFKGHGLPGCGIDDFVALVQIDGDGTAALPVEGVEDDEAVGPAGMASARLAMLLRVIRSASALELTAYCCLMAS